MRFGRWPAVEPRAGDTKAIDPVGSVSAVMGTSIRATRFYVWRSAGDARVRDSHAERDGKVFAWSEPPPGGHPGREPNYRCWPVPYYGDPAVPDSLVLLDYQQIAIPDWLRIETLRRPDGSLAQSLLTLPDGTRLRSRFWRTLIARTVTFVGGDSVRVIPMFNQPTVSIGR